MNYFKRYTLLLLVFALILPLQAQKKREKRVLLDPAFRGFSVNFDIASPFMGLVFDKNVVNVEAFADVNLYNIFFPVFEIGYGSIDQTIVNGANYSASAPFWRIGMDFNIIGVPDTKYEIGHLKHYAYAGVRYGMSIIDYHMSDVPYYDDFWNEPQLFNYSGIGTYTGWLELVGGIRIDVAYGLTMGWSVRFRSLFHTSAPGKEYLWYVPGYGNASKTNFNFTYSIGYTFFTAKKHMNKAIVNP